MNKVDVLFFAAHPDDVELSCSGTVIKLVKEGKKIGIVDLTQGEKGTRGSRKIRKKEAEAATKALKIHYRKNLKLPDANIEYNNKSKIKIIKQIRHLKPKVVFCNINYDRHPDHGNSSKLVKDACFYSGLSKIDTKYKGEAQKEWRPQSVFFYIQDYYHKPSFVIDISEHIEEKYKVINCYKSQFYNPNSKEKETPLTTKTFFEYLKGRDAGYGRLIGKDYGEGFVSENPIEHNIL